MSSRARSQHAVSPADRRFGALLRLTLWSLGLLVSLMTGMVSAYLVLTGVYVGSRVVARLRAGDRGGSTAG